MNLVEMLDAFCTKHSFLFLPSFRTDDQSYNGEVQEQEDAFAIFHYKEDSRVDLCEKI